MMSRGRYFFELAKSTSFFFLREDEGEQGGSLSNFFHLTNSHFGFARLDNLPRRLDCSIGIVIAVLNLLMDRITRRLLQIYPK